MALDLSFYKGKTVLITGHTGFKGSWLCRILVNAGARVVGYSLTPPTNPSLFEIAGIGKKLVSVIGDVRDFIKLLETFRAHQPEIVFHLAAQPLVRLSYREPRYTYEANVMGTCNVLECVRLTNSVKSFLNVTTDKVYLNDVSQDHPFAEDEPLDGYDPYSNSKSCSELITHSYKKSFFSDGSVAISTARAGNVIGGGDFAEDRIIPDAVRAIQRGEDILVRNPHSIRPYQHVLEPLYVYLLIAEAQAKNITYAGYYNVGPDECDCVTTGALMDLFVSFWHGKTNWRCTSCDGPHEAAFLRLDNSKIKKVFGWKPRWHIHEAVDKTVAWTKTFLANPEGVLEEMDHEIDEFFGEEIA